jgi:hypothetical protein
MHSDAGMQHLRLRQQWIPTRCASSKAHITVPVSCVPQPTLSLSHARKGMVPRQVECAVSSSAAMNEARAALQSNHNRTVDMMSAELVAGVNTECGSQGL